MSGQPYVEKSDMDKYRQEYMDNLATEIQMNDANLQANKIYLATGQLPAVSSIPDNRKTEEKLNDYEQLKRDLIKSLKPLMDPSLATVFVEELTKSSYNTDNRLLTFVAQRINEIVKVLSKSYQYGLKDYNDAVSSVKYMEKMFVQNDTNASTVKDLSNRLTKDQKKYASSEDVKLVKDSVQAAIKILAPYSFIQRDDGIYDTDDKIKDIVIMLTQLINGLPSNSEMQKNDRNFQMLTIHFDEVSHTYDSNYIDTFISTYNKFTQVMSMLPTRTFFIDFVNGINKSSSIVGNDEQKFIRMRLYLSKLYDTLVKINMRELHDLKNLLKQYNNTVEAPVRENNVPQDIPQEVDQPILEDFDPNPVLNRGGFGRRGRQPPSQNIVPYVPRVPEPVINDLVNKLLYKIELLQAKENNIISEISEIREDRVATPMLRERKIGKLDTRLQNIRQKIQQYYLELHAEEERLNNAGVEEHKGGEGHGFKKRVGRPKGSGIKQPFTNKVDLTKGVQRSPLYISFGNHLINHKKLTNDIISLRGQSGSSVKDMKSTKVSNHFGSIVRKIVGGGSPSYDEMSKLSEEEKIYLHKLATKSNLHDKLSIPTPSKDAMDKDIHEFEVAKGEIMSGNDNKELIKKFKILILKLKRNGVLPKGQVDDIIEELLQMGY